MFTGKPKLKVHLAPPLLARVDPQTGRPQTRAFGSWVFGLFRLLQHLKVLRGTPFDVFGYTAERRQERALIAQYERDMGVLVERIHAGNVETATAIARLPEEIRGFGPVKKAAIESAETKRMALWREFDRPPQQRAAA